MKKRTTKLTGTVKRAAAAGLALCMFCGTSGQAQAATLKDLFDEHYYADEYSDLKDAFGYDKDALWNHFITHGLEEGRNMNSLLDVVKYRKMYQDLDKAFGDNWDAYLNHYLTCGAKEGRDTGTGFSALDYAARYDDLRAVYGNDILALYGHYHSVGEKENREARPEKVVTAEREAEKAAAEAAEAATQEPDEAQKPAETQKPITKPAFPEESIDRSEREESGDGGWTIVDYDEAGNEVSKTTYNADGTVKNKHICH